MMVTTGGRDFSVSSASAMSKRPSLDNPISATRIHRVAEFDRHQFRHVGVDHVAGLHHLALLHEVLDEIDGPFGHTLRQFLDGDGLRQDDLAQDLLCAAPGSSSA